MELLHEQNTPEKTAETTGQTLKLGLVYILALVLCGCSFIQQANTYQQNIRARADGYDPVHIRACGPEALHGLFAYHGMYVSHEEISRDIIGKIGYSRFVRNTLGLFANDAHAITWHHEVVDYIRSKGLHVISAVGPHQELLRAYNSWASQGRSGIVLMKQQGISTLFHYEWFPQLDSNGVLVDIFIYDPTVIVALLIIIE